MHCVAARSQTALSDVGEQDNERLLTEAARISDLGADLSAGYPEADLQSQSFDLMAQLEEQSDGVPTDGAHCAEAAQTSATRPESSSASHQTPANGSGVDAPYPPASIDSATSAHPDADADADVDAVESQALTNSLYDSVVTREQAGGKKLKLVLRKRPSTSFNGSGGTTRSGGRNAAAASASERESGSSNFTLVSNHIGVVSRSSTRIRIRCNNALRAASGASGGTSGTVADDAHADSFGKLARMASAAGTNGFAALSRSRQERERLSSPSNAHHYRDRSATFIRSLPMARKNGAASERLANSGAGGGGNGSAAETISNGHAVVTNQLEAAVSSILADTESNTSSSDPFAIRSQFDSAAADIDILI